MNKLDNIFICTNHRCASTFLKNIFLKNKFNYEKTIHYEINLLEYLFGSYKYQKEVKVEKNRIITNVYCDYNCFINRITKSENYKGIYVYRNPLELATSTYYSWIFSHGALPQRQMLETIKDEFNKWKFVIDTIFVYQGILDSMIDWVKNCKDERIKIYKLEDISKNDESQNIFLKEMFNHLNIEINDKELEKIQDENSFKKISGGRNRGEININNHYRSGNADSYKTQMPSKVYNYIMENYGNKIKELGY